MAFLTTETSLIMGGDGYTEGGDVIGQLSMANLVQADIEMDLDSQDKEDLLYADELDFGSAEDLGFDNPFADMESDNSDASDIQSLEEDFALAAGSLGGHLNQNQQPLDFRVMEEEENPQRLRRAEAGRYGFDIVVIGGRAYPADNLVDQIHWQALQQQERLRGALGGAALEGPVEGVVCETSTQAPQTARAELDVDRHGLYRDDRDRTVSQDDNRQTSFAEASTRAAAVSSTLSPPTLPQPGVSPPPLFATISSLTSLETTPWLTSRSTTSSFLSTNFGAPTVSTLHHPFAGAGQMEPVMRGSIAQQGVLVGYVGNGGVLNASTSTPQGAVRDLLGAMAGAYESAAHTGDNNTVNFISNEVQNGALTSGGVQQSALRNLAAATAASMYIGGRSQDGVQQPLANAFFKSTERFGATVDIGGRGQDGVQHHLTAASSGVQTFSANGVKRGPNRSRDMLRKKPKSLKPKLPSMKTFCQLALSSLLAPQPAIMVC